MLFEQIAGQKPIKDYLQSSSQKGRISHAQLIIGTEGSGALPLAIAYAQKIIAESVAEKESDCDPKFEKFAHPDLHFAFPVNTNKNVKKDPISDNFLAEWRHFLTETPYGNLNDWYQQIEIENKQGIIGADEAAEIQRKISLKSYEGGYKAVIIWHAEKMNPTCANKLLKLLEEPPADTLFLLITEKEGDLLPTIESRCQKIILKRLSDPDIADYLSAYKQIPREKALQIARLSQGDMNRALKLIETDPTDNFFEEQFVKWVRAAFMANKNAGILKELISWADQMSSLSREKQKQFLQYAADLFRQALLKNYTADSLVSINPQSNGFNFEKFTRFIHGNNIEKINQELNLAQFHIERNGNSRLVFLDMSIKITRLLHIKAV